MNNNKLKNYKSNSITRITEIFKTIFSRKRTEKSNTDEEQSAVIENNKRLHLTKKTYEHIGKHRNA